VYFVRGEERTARKGRIERTKGGRKRGALLEKRPAPQKGAWKAWGRLERPTEETLEKNQRYRQKGNEQWKRILKSLSTGGGGNEGGKGETSQVAGSELRAQVSERRWETGDESTSVCLLEVTKEYDRIGKIGKRPHRRRKKNRR